MSSHPHQMVRTIDYPQIVAALDMCDDISDTPAKPSDHIANNIVLSSRRARITRNKQYGTYVAFGGSEPRGVGTWCIVNFQAAATSFAAIDASLEHRGSSPALKVQGAATAAIAPGRVHQGFFRTWSHLWYGTDVIATAFLDRQRPRFLFALRSVAAALVGLGIAWWGDAAWPTVLLSGLVGGLLYIAWDSGGIERLFWRGTPQNRAVVDHLFENGEPTEPVWFVGHSLGGALATLAFAAYRNRCATSRQSGDAYLVTFGAPLVGDAEFIADFERRHGGRYLHVVRDDDPVTFSPPAAIGTRDRAAPRGHWRWVVLIFAAIWQTVMRVFWAASHPYANWPIHARRHRVGGWTTAFRHTRKSYRRAVEEMKNTSPTRDAMSGGLEG